MWLIAMGAALAAEPTEDVKVAEEAEDTKIDVAAMFKGQPAEGERRCRSKKPDVAYVTTSYTGGPAPYSGMVVGTAVLIVDRVQIGAVVYKADVAGPPPTFAVQTTRSEALTKPAQTYGEVTRTREHLVLSRPDGSELVAGKKQLELTWVCESVMYPPRP